MKIKICADSTCDLPPERKRRYCLCLTALDHFYWVAGVTAGALVGSALPFPADGIDFAMTALFLVILTDQCRDGANRLPALVGGGAAVAVFAVLAAAVGAARADMLIPTMGLMVTALLLLRGRIERAGRRRT